MGPCWEAGLVPPPPLDSQHGVGRGPWNLRSSRRGTGQVGQGGTRFPGASWDCRWSVTATTGQPVTLTPGDWRKPGFLVPGPRQGGLVKCPSPGWAALLRSEGDGSVKSPAHVRVLHVCGRESPKSFQEHRPGSSEAPRTPRRLAPPPPKELLSAEQKPIRAQPTKPMSDQDQHSPGMGPWDRREGKHQPCHPGFPHQCDTGTHTAQTHTHRDTHKDTRSHTAPGHGHHQRREALGPFCDKRHQNLHASQKRLPMRWKLQRGFSFISVSGCPSFVQSAAEGDFPARGLRPGTPIM